jgi:hypothetical protein
MVRKAWPDVLPVFVIDGDATGKFTGTCVSPEEAVCPLAVNISFPCSSSILRATNPSTVHSVFDELRASNRPVVALSAVTWDLLKTISTWLAVQSANRVVDDVDGSVVAVD